MSSDSISSPGTSKLAWTASFLLLLGFCASVMFGPQLAVWPSGPALLCLALAAVAALLLPVRLPAAVWISGLLLAGWLGYRCATSAVVDFAVADAALLGSCVAVFWIARAVLSRRGATEVLFVGLGLLVLVNWLPMLAQAKDPEYAPWLPRGTETFPSGFFAYYGDCAAFLVGMALLAGGLVWDGRRSRWFRVFMAVVAVAAAAGVMFTKARGGILGLGVGSLVLLCLAPWLLMKRGSRGVGVLTLALPLLLIAGILVLGEGLADAQTSRGQDAGDGAMFDNVARLLWLKLAISSIGSHLWTGGGSRSFSWENFQFWGEEWRGHSTTEPEFVHNEFVQMTTDFGLLGLLLLVVFLGAAVATGIIGRWAGSEAKAESPLFVAGLAALAALLVHAGFHFVFHVPPATWLLGLALAFVIAPAGAAGAAGAVRPGWWAGVFSALVPAACAGVLGFFGWKSVAVLREMSPLIYRFGPTRPDGSEALSMIARAQRIWPGYSLDMRQGKVSLAAASGSEGAERQMLLGQAENSFREASARHPFDPEAAVNFANVLSAREIDDRAEVEFQRAIELQGGMELAFRARYSASVHYFRKAARLRRNGALEAGLESLQRAAELFDRDTSPGAGEYGAAGRAHRISLALYLGSWLDSLGRHEDATREYERAALIPGSEAISYPMARSLAGWGDELWLERRPELALKKFELAHNRLRQAESLGLANDAGATELRQHLEHNIKFLRGAGIRSDPAGP